MLLVHMCMYRKNDMPTQAESISWGFPSLLFPSWEGESAHIGNIHTSTPPIWLQHSCCTWYQMRLHHKEVEKTSVPLSSAFNWSRYSSLLWKKKPYLFTCHNAIRYKHQNLWLRKQKGLFQRKNTLGWIESTFYIKEWVDFWPVSSPSFYADPYEHCSEAQ